MTIQVLGRLDDDHSKSSSHPSPHVAMELFFLVMRTFRIYSVSNVQRHSSSSPVLLKR